MWQDPPATLERVTTPRGELVLRRDGDRYEIISNGVFLMDTSDGESERLLIDAALERCQAASPRLLIGGLGVGFSLAQAVTHARLGHIDVVEIEGSIIGWHARHLQHISGEAMRDPRVRVIEADILDWLSRTADEYDAICLDTDNGPSWLVFDSNSEVYAARGLGLARDRLASGGVLAVWSASREGAYEERLGATFGDVTVLETPRERGAPDVVYLATRVDAAGH
jgi:spermidine synthase